MTHSKSNRMTTISEAEQLLGRPLKKIEHLVFNLYHDDDRYIFYKDDKGYLAAKRKSNG